MSAGERSGKDGSGAPVDPDAPTRISDADDERVATTVVEGAGDGAEGVEDAEDEEQEQKAQADETTVDETDPDEAPTVVRPRSGATDPDDARRPTAATVVDPAAQARGPASGDVDVDAPTRVSDHAPGDASGATEPPASSGIEPGSVLFGEYEIIEVLGAGGMGEVYKARHRRLGEFRAIKMMHAELATRPGASEFFLREAKALLAVRHPAVVHCHDLLSDAQGRVYLIMEMIEGTPLSERMQAGALPADQVVLLGARLAAGLQAAHACGVVHRDVSPDNVVLPGGDVEQAKLIDFGIAKILEEGQGTIVDGFKGKLSYASPEQLGFFGGKIDGRSDFYSLGLVLCAAVLGRAMGMGTTVVEAVDARRGFQHVPDEIPVGLRSALEPLLALDPKDRPKKVERLFLAPGAEQAGLDAIRAETGAGAKERGPGFLRGIVAAAAVAFGVLGYLLFSGGGSVDPPAAEQAGAPPAAAGSEVTPAAPSEPAPAAAPTARGQAPPRAAPEEKPPAKRRLTALDEIRIVGLLRGAEAALAENRLQSPKGDNAYEKYRAVLEIDPDNQPARRGLVAVAGRYLALTEQALAKTDLEKARTYLARASAIAPHHPRLDTVRAEVDSATP